MTVFDRAWIDMDSGDRFDRVIEGVLCALLAFMPLAFGTVEAWSEEVVMALAVAMAVAFCLRMLFVPGTSIVWTWAYVPIVGFILLAVLQMIALPIGLVQFLSPHTVSQKLELLGDLDSAQAPVSHVTISFYPYATWHDLRLVLAAAAVFFVVLNTVRRPDQIARVLWIVSVVGGVVAVEALAQATFGNGKLYWCVPIPHDVAVSGPFVNHSHFAQFMNLSLGAAMGLVLVQVRRALHGRSVTAALVIEHLGSREGKVLLWLILGMALGVASIFVSLSRGGIISMMCAGTATVLVIGAGRSIKGSAWVLALLALGAFICVLYVGFDAVYDRLGTLSDVDTAEGGRWQILKDIATAWVQFPLLGTGLGTHEVVYPMFDRATIPAIASHAENEYAQAAEETGIVGLLLLIAFGIIVSMSYVRAIRTVEDPTHCAAYGLGFGLMAIMVHSLSDFGQHLPANGFLSVLYCALLIRLPSVSLEAQCVSDCVGGSNRPDRGVRRAGMLALAGVCVVGAIVLLDADAARCAAACWTQTLRAERSMVQKEWRGNDQEFTYLLSHSAQAHEYQPDSIVYRYWLNVYRWRAISRANDPNTGELIVSPQLIEFARRIAEELKQGLRQCPTYGPMWTILGQMERDILSHTEEGSRHILRGRRLAPNDSITCLVTGILYAEQGSDQAAVEHLKRAVVLDEALFVEAMTICVHTLDRPDMAVELASDDVSRLLRVEQVLADAKSYPDLLPVLSNRIVCLVERECIRPGAPAWYFAWLGQRYRTDARNDEAVQMYRKALALEYSQVSWRFLLAQLLSEQGLVSEATRELKIILDLRPQHDAARQLLARLALQE
jgi:tetratricopeptide (TPR) repeat protein